MIIGTFKQDNDCHWYFVPLHKVEEFDELLKDGEPREEEFLSKFNEHMCDDPENYSVAIDEKCI